MNIKERFIDFTGGLFFIFGLTAIINSFLFYGIQHVLWFCYAGLILMGIGFLKRNHLLVESQLNILSVPLIVWTIDFFYFLIFNHSLLNIVDYFFEPGPLLSKVITSQHLFTLPLAVYAIRFIPPKSENSWKFSFIQVSIIFLISRVLTDYEQNINWVYHTSLNLGIPSNYYAGLWFVMVFIMILVTNLALRKIQSIN